MGARALFPVCVKDDTFAPPSGDAPYYVLAGDGLYLTRRTELFTACVPAAGVAGLSAHAATFELHVPMVPRRLVEEAVGFFREVWRRHGGEAILFMFYDPEHRRFAFTAPPQRLPRGASYAGWYGSLRLDYEDTPAPGASFRRLGTIHSHGWASPHHSLTDVHDEAHDTGLHLTAGYVDSERPEFAAAFVVSGTRFTVSPNRVLAGFRAPRAFPPEWLAQVQTS